MTMDVIPQAVSCDFAFANSSWYPTMSYSGPWAAGSTVTVQWSHVTLGTPTMITWQVVVWDDSGSEVNRWTYGSGDTGPNSFAFYHAAANAVFKVAFIQAGFGGTGNAYGVQVSGGTCTGLYCQYGTQLRDSTQTLLILSAALITALSIPSGMEWIIPIVLAHAGLWVDLNHLCSTVPPPVEDITFDDWWQRDPVSGQVLAVGKVEGNLNNLIWDKFCQ